MGSVGSVIVSLLPLIIGAAVVPLWIIMVLFLLRGEGGLGKAIGFAAGITAVRLVQGVLFGYIFNAAAESSGESGGNLIVSTLLLVIGILMLITAYKQWRKEDDPDAPPPKWMAMISGLSVAKAFGLGALLVAIAAKQWVFTLSAIGIIAEAPLSQAENVIAFLIYALAAASFVLAPTIVHAVAPKQSAKTLAAAQEWLAQHNRQIVIAVSLIFGMYFVFRSVAGLTG